MMMKLAALAAAAGPALVRSHNGYPINPALGVPGYPDCYLPKSAAPPADGALPLSVEETHKAMVCFQRQGKTADAIKVATVGDSITAGVCSSGGPHTYPSQLQDLLGDGYAVTNLGACGSTMLKHGNSPYWLRPE